MRRVHSYVNIIVEIKLMTSSKQDAAPLSPENQRKLNNFQMAIKTIATTCDFAWLSELPTIHTKETLNTIRMSKDADKYAAGLNNIFRRIPDDWGRWISCDAGWYQIIFELDQQLAAIRPDYEVYQVKEGYGTLRYYCDANEAMTQLIKIAEAKSAKTCEICAARGIMGVKNGWYKTLCPICAIGNGYARCM